MFTRKMIKQFADSFSIGQTLERENRVLATERQQVNEKVRIIAKKKDFCIVTNGHYDYCIAWVDLMKKQMGDLSDTSFESDGPDFDCILRD